VRRLSIVNFGSHSVESCGSLAHCYSCQPVSISCSRCRAYAQQSSSSCSVSSLISKPSVFYVASLAPRHADLSF